MLSLGKMLRSTARKIWRNARGIKVRTVSSRWGRTPDKLNYFEVLIKAKSTTASLRPGIHKVVPHNVIIRQYGADPVALAAGGIKTTNPSWVHCDCEHFLFTCEYALTSYGSSSIIDSNGKPPVFTNPKLLPCICKHIIAVVAIHPNLMLPDLDKNIIDPAKLEVMRQERVPTKTEKKLLDLLGGDDEDED